MVRISAIFFIIISVFYAPSLLYVKDTPFEAHVNIQILEKGLGHGARNVIDFQMFCAFVAVGPSRYGGWQTYDVAEFYDKLAGAAWLLDCHGDLFASVEVRQDLLRTFHLFILVEVRDESRRLHANLHGYVEG